MSFLPIGKKLINASARQMQAAYNTPIVSEKWLDNYPPELVYTSFICIVYTSFTCI